ncbi:anti-sigma factor family protein [Streptomyces sp. NBC_01506]|uniref:anti-sigma factor family protein n=1 Tax=Streptomyces sp. NBC_01506 TaxID=2903887 RepID=UPI003869F8F9
MTTTTGTTEHPDVSEISDLTEGLLSPTRSVEVRDHLDGCPVCADVYESLEEIRGLLGSLPGPPRMPADVAARVDAALAAEALLSATAPDHVAESVTADVSRETSRADETATHETDDESGSEPAPAAVTPGATAAVTPATDASRADRPAGHPRAATGPGRARRLRRRRGAILGAVFGTAAIGVSVLLFQTVSSTGGSDKSSYKADSGESQANGGGEVFSGTGIQDKVHSLLTTGDRHLSGKGDPGVNSTKEAPSSAASPTLQIQVPPCVLQGTGRKETPLAAEKGTYDGIDAFLVVLSDPADSSLVRAYVVDAACVDVTPPVKGELLLTQTYPRR